MAATPGPSEPPAEAEQEQEEPATWRVVNPDGFVNIRAEPSASGEILGRKEPGDEVRGVRAGDWLALSDEVGFMLIVKPDDGQALLELVEEHIRGPAEIVEDAERVAEEMGAVAREAARQLDEDELLPSIGARGDERRAAMRLRAELAEAAAARLAEEAKELADYAKELQEEAAEAARLLVPPPPPPEPEEGAEEVEVQSSSEPWAPSPQDVADAKRLAKQSAEAMRRAFRCAQAARRAAEAAETVRATSDEAEAEERRRRQEAEKKAGFWATARTEEAGSAVVWLHGQGESEAAWQTLLSGISIRSAEGPCRWIWPRAELIPCSTRGGVLTPQWFDTPEYPVCRVVRGVPDRPRREEEPREVARAVRRVHATIEALEAEGIPSDRIVLAGFGQGAALAVHAALRFQRPLAGGVMLSGWLPVYEVLKATSEAAAPPEGRPPLDILWCHGARDAVVEPGLAGSQAAALEALGVKVDFRLYPELAYGVDDEVVAALEAWLVARLGGPPPDPPEAEQEERERSAEQEAAAER